MEDGPFDLPYDFDGKKSIDVQDLAVQALALLASGHSEKGSDSLSERVDELLEAVIHEDGMRRHSVVSRLISSGVQPEDVVDRYVPLTASKLGSLWIQDKLSFTEVTIGAGRLQEMVRSLGKRAHQPGATIPLGHSILMVVPMQEDHMLGSFIAASQFRRMGMWVHIAIGQQTEELISTINSQPYEMLGFSAAGRRTIEPLKALIKRIRKECDATPSIVIGGQISNLDIDVCALTGADYVTSNPREALELCGLLELVAMPEFTGS